LANPQAAAANRRYIDRDLNRCFVDSELSNPELVNYEEKLAKAIAAQLCPNGQPSVDVIIDLHSTTANMGLTILPSSTNPFNLHLSAYLSQLDPAVRVCLGESYGQDSPMLRSLVPLGCVIEVGAVAQGVLDARLLQQTEMLVHAILDYIDAYNQGKLLPIPDYLTVYQVIDSLDYPRNAVGELQAAIHPQLQFKDYQPLNPGDPLFLTFTGEAIAYEGESTVFPIFINEAAYYEKQIALTLTEKQEIWLAETEKASQAHF
jgi:aspartoacylase